MSEKNDLHKLVHSLTPSERAYFKKYVYKSKNDQDNQYIKIFDLIVKQLKYDEVALKLKIQNIKILKNFSATKSYLEELILNTLNSSCTSSSITSKITTMINHVHFLLEKNIPSIAKKKLNYIRNVIFDFELYEYYAPYFKYYNVILSYNNDDSIERENLVNEYNLVINYLANIQTYETLKNLSFDFKRRNEILYVRVQEQKEIRNFIFQNKWLQDVRDAKTTRSKLLFYFVRNQYWLMSNELEHAYEDTFQQYTLLKNNPNYCKINPKDYAVTIGNFIKRMQNIGDFTYMEEAKQNMLKILNEIQDKEFIQAKKFDIIYVDRNLWIDNHQFHKLKSILPEMLHTYEHYYKHRKDTRIAICNDIALTYFYIDDFTSALDYINQLLNDDYIKHSKDLESYAHLIRVLLFIELNTDILNYNTIENLRKKLYRDDKLYTAEKYILKILEDYCGVPDKKQKITILKESKLKLKELLDINYNINLLKYIPIDLWIEAKIHGKTIYQHFNKTK